MYTLSFDQNVSQMTNLTGPVFRFSEARFSGRLCMENTQFSPKAVIKLDRIVCCVCLESHQHVGCVAACLYFKMMPFSENQVLV